MVQDNPAPSAKQAGPDENTGKQIAAVAKTPTTSGDKAGPESEKQSPTEDDAMRTAGVKTADYDAIATGTWIRAMPGETELQDNWASIPQQTPVDVIIRARVKKVSGQNLGLYLRSEELPPPERKFGYAAWFNGSNSFGVFKWSEGSKGDLLTCQTANNFDDYFEFAFSAIGELLSMYPTFRKSRREFRGDFAGVA